MLSGQGEEAAEFHFLLCQILGGHLFTHGWFQQPPMHDSDAHT